MLLATATHLEAKAVDDALEMFNVLVVNELNHPRRHRDRHLTLRTRQPLGPKPSRIQTDERAS